MSDEKRTISRRAMIAAAGGVTGALAFVDPMPVVATTRAGTPGLTPTAVDGPYFTDEKLIRSDVTEGQSGIPLELRLRVLDIRGGVVSKTRVDMWHANAQGDYSGYDLHGDNKNPAVVGQTFLRGTQYTDGDGWVQFSSIYPGWYQARTPHVHFKIYVEPRCILTGQLYFPDALSEYIYTNVSSYQRRDVRDTLNVSDKHKKRAGDSTVGKISEVEGGYVAELELTVDTTADFALAPPPPGHPPPYAPTLPILYGDTRVAALIPSAKKRT